MDTPLSILERAERETLLVSQQRYELLHVHTLGTWGSSRGDVRSMARKEKRVMWRGNKMNETSKKNSPGGPSMFRSIDPSAGTS